MVVAYAEVLSPQTVPLHILDVDSFYRSIHFSNLPFLQPDGYAGNFHCLCFCYSITPGNGYSLCCKPDIFRRWSKAVAKSSRHFPVPPWASNGGILYLGN